MFRNFSLLYKKGSLCLLLLLVYNITLAQNNGTIIDNVTWALNNAPPNTSPANSLLFTYGKVVPTSTIQVGTTGAISIWFKIGSFNNILVNHSTLNDYVSTPNSTTIGVNIANLSYHEFTVPPMSTISAGGSWYNLILTREAGITRIYLNGTQSSTPGISQSGTFSINQFGAYSGSTGYDWEGNMAEFRVFNSALTTTDIANLAAGNGPVTASILHWKMNEGSGTNVVDHISGTGSTGGTGGTTTSQWTTSGNNIYNNNIGNVGIGTTNPTEKLSVNGNIRTRKLIVTLSDWPDYVFHKNYKLPSLKEIEKFITLNHHLPGIPSAKEVEKNGLNVGDNQALLLKKIEELTLIIIQQEKRIKVLEKDKK